MINLNKDYKIHKSVGTILVLNKIPFVENGCMIIEKDGTKVPLITSETLFRAYIILIQEESGEQSLYKHRDISTPCIIKHV